MSGKRYRLPLPLRFFHLVGLVGFSASAVAAAWPELTQVYVVLHYKYWCGTPPGWLAVGGAALALVTMTVVLVGIALEHPPPIWLSAFVLAGFGMALTGLSREVSQRTPSGANLAFLDVGRNEQEFFRQVGRTVGLDEKELPEWNRSLTNALDAAKFHSPYRAGFREVLPLTIRVANRKDEFPSDAPPGTLLVWLGPSGRDFELRLIGLDDFHHPALLKDELGNAFSFTGGGKDDIF